VAIGASKAMGLAKWSLNLTAGHVVSTLFGYVCLSVSMFHKAVSLSRYFSKVTVGSISAALSFLVSIPPRKELASGEERGLLSRTATFNIKPRRSRNHGRNQMSRVYKEKQKSFLESLRFRLMSTGFFC